MICEECPLAERCIERRGLCRDCIRYMERVERVRKEIEKLNETAAKKQRILQSFGVAVL